MELRLYNSQLIKVPSIILANKMDEDTSEENLKIFREKLKGNQQLIIPIVAKDRFNLDKVKICLRKLVPTKEEEEAAAEGQ